MWWEKCIFSCHSSLPSMVLIIADKFEMQCWWWGNASSCCRGKWNQHNGCWSVDSGFWRGGNFSGTLLKHETHPFENSPPFENISQSRFECYKLHKVFQLDVFLVWSLFSSKIFDLVTLICPLHLLHIYRIFLQVTIKNKCPFTEKQNRIFSNHIFIALMQGWSQDQW